MVWFFENIFSACIKRFFLAQIGKIPTLGTLENLSKNDRFFGKKRFDFPVRKLWGKMKKKRLFNAFSIGITSWMLARFWKFWSKWSLSAKISGLHLLKLDCTLPNLATICLQKSTCSKYILSQQATMARGIKAMKTCLWIFNSVYTCSC